MMKAKIIRTVSFPETGGDLPYYEIEFEYKNEKKILNIDYENWNRQQKAITDRIKKMWSTYHSIK